ncbi:MAG TPA: YjhG/YagF family D-xylonate dehydratase [Dehalococcoidia bacterium]|jgi:putative YjhG/YagF family dehydratase|nr:YjhG/YagF family D-xylonate dehydratase [Chloroflexota bacterium]MDP7089944.1 YjhG/YagF family D-xylonate dehydratase [Dehalococcoidia bacterium]MDP7262234.1 YjhG/YagF family D-xylonate dehydratase [Dehalococcoidia bacterium]MDP7485358.1 YjhG/YagF family D-xylonate dehydratase [Dehalococcoidia bacterium]HJP28798.1 YjhG/YagF family D-xylonate dehydratase [Dehalococcoidia bacterium]|tara:strand:+ start:9452 stop:11473 length:2022 start_codon:yes stop_codon:yes gene_type:complete
MTSRVYPDNDTSEVSIADVLGTGANPASREIQTHADGPKGTVPFTAEFLIDEPSGNHFGMTQNAGMGWNPSELMRKQFIILSTVGGVKNEDGSPVALGLHTGHFELRDMVAAAAEELKELKSVPFAAFCSDPCDGRTQGTTGMLDSLPYRNDAAQVFRRIVRSLPTVRGVLGVASCDKGLPAMMMALAGLHNQPGVIVPGGTTLKPHVGEDTGQIQSIGARFAQGEVTLEYAQDVGCRSCASPGGGCQFLGTAGTSQVVSEALGLAITHAALSPSGTPSWFDIARRSARALVMMERRGVISQDILVDAAFENAMAVHAACGGSTNLMLHMPAIAHAAGRTRMGVDDWNRVNLNVPRLVDVLPNGPVGYPTTQLYAAGGVPEVMLHLRTLGLIDTSVQTATGQTLEENLCWWEDSERRYDVRKYLRDVDGIDPDDVIMSPDRASKKNLTSTVTFPMGNIAPEGSVIKSTAIDPSVVDDDNVYRNKGPARVFRSELAAMGAIKSRDDDHKIKAGDIMVVTCGGPLGTGMEEVYQLTAALTHLSYGKQIALITDARFSGVSTGACIGHVGPEALAGGPIGRVEDGDLIEIVVDRKNLSGSLNLVGIDGEVKGVDWGTAELEKRGEPGDLAPHPQLPDDSRLWASLQSASGGTWGGCVFDVDLIVETLDAGKKALGR